MRNAAVVMMVALSFIVSRDARAVGCTPSKTLTCGSVVTDSLSSSSGCILNTFPTAVYAFNGTAGQTVDLTASDSSGFTISLTLADSSGNTIGGDFDEPASVHATLPSTGQYTVSINFGNPHQSGSFTLTTSCTTAPPPATCTSSGSVSIGSMVSAQLNANDRACGDSTSYAKLYKMQVNAGDAFEVDYDAVGFPPYIEILGPDTSAGYRWAKSPATSLVTYYLAPIAGTVNIYLASNTTTPTSGSFTMKILPLVQPPCGKARAVRH